MTTTTPAMPDLPDVPLIRFSTGHGVEWAKMYTADQMRAYALATLQAQPAAAGVSDAGAPFGMLRTTCPYCEQGFAFDRPEVDASDELVDQHLDAILRAAGSALRHYTMQKSKDDMRSALRRAILALRPQAVPMTDEKAALEEEEFSLLSQTQVAALLWVLWCHQGASSPVGQPIRFALGMDKRQAMSDEQVSAAQRFRIDWHQWSGITAPAGGEKQA